MAVGTVTEYAIAGVPAKMPANEFILVPSVWAKSSLDYVWVRCKLW